MAYTITKYIFLLFTLLLFACETPSTSQEATIAERLDVPSFKEKLAATPNAVLIDIRTADECANGMIEGAKAIDFYQDDFDTRLNALDKNQTTFIYCQGGGRSGKALKKMKEMGFKEVYELKTGYGSWVD